LRIGLDTAFEEPGGEVPSELFGTLLQLSEGRGRRLGILGEEAVEDGIGVFVPLAAQVVSIRGTGRRAVTHGDSFSGNSSGP
jgi:hypothetical protein